MSDLFEEEQQRDFWTHAPLADRMRPETLEQFVGQDEIVGPGKPLRHLLDKGMFHSAIFWGPPGSGKTTLARLVAKCLEMKFVPFSAVTSGIKEIKEVMGEAEREQALYGKQTILFIDEIHRFNKAQQDAFLPYVEAGKIILLGATTENPSFEVIGALLSRLKVYVLKPLSEHAIDMILEGALRDSARGLGRSTIELDKDARDYITQTASGDARKALTLLELACQADEQWESGNAHITLDRVVSIQQKKTLLYDKSGEEHYNLISALHKSLRDSDPDAALYWLARMLEAGEDPLYVARRMVRFAVEDIGLADPSATTVALNAKEVYDFLGTPEGELALAMAAIYLATAPKSNRVYEAYNEVTRTIESEPAYGVPHHIRNPVTALMQGIGYGKGYQYAHDHPDTITGQEDLPPELADRTFYHPSDHGLEKKIAERLQYWEKLRQEARKQQSQQ